MAATEQPQDPILALAERLVLLKQQKEDMHRRLAAVEEEIAHVLGEYEQLRQSLIQGGAGGPKSKEVVKEEASGQEQPLTLKRLIVNALVHAAPQPLSIKEIIAADEEIARRIGDKDLKISYAIQGIKADFPRLLIKKDHGVWGINMREYEKLRQEEREAESEQR